MGAVSSRDDTATTAEDRRPGAYRRAKDLDPLFEVPPLEERLRLGLGRFVLLKETSRDKNIVPFSNSRCRAPQISQDHESRLAAMWKNSTENRNEEK